MTQKERDDVLKRLAESVVEQNEYSATRHGEMGERIAKLETELRLYREGSWTWLIRYLISEVTKTTIGTVALLVLFSILILAMSAVALGSDKVLEILADKVSIHAITPMEK